MRVPTIADLQESKASVEKNSADVAAMVGWLKCQKRVDTVGVTAVARWVVVEHGTADSDGWELSVCVSGTHGCKSYGWDGEEKHIVWSKGGPCGYTPHPLLVGDYRRMASELAEKLNAVD